ncbi:MAG TPA: hypothetical protein VK624_17190 [Steroidobacteraceae bacterium]|nr:hypothetical protein [Steroidobacteraceae bacterium]
MYRLTQGLATIFCLSVLQGCGGGGGGGGKAPESQQPPPSNTRPPLKVSAADYQLALRTSIGTTMNAFNYVKLGGDLADLMLDLPVPRDVVLLPCPDGGTTLLTIGDRNSDGLFNAGDYVNQAYEDCDNDGSTLDGIIRIEIDSVTPKDGGREIQLLATVVNLTLKLADSAIPPISVNFVGPVSYTRTPSYQEFRLAGASFSSSQVAGATDVTALGVIYLQDHAADTYRLTFGGSLDSAMFSGPFEFATFAPFTGTIGQYPDAGRLDVIGGSGSSARLSEEGAAASNPATVLVAVDSNGDGTADAAVIDFPWSDVMPRELFDAFRNPVVVATPLMP